MGAFGLATFAYINQKSEIETIPQATEGMQLIEFPNAADLLEGEMKELKVGEGKQDKVLVSRVKGKIHACGAFCSHFGLPLSWGALFDDKVMCPAHAAGFSVVSG